MGLVKGIGSLLTFVEGLELKIDEGLTVGDMDFLFWTGTIKRRDETADEEDEVEGHGSPKNLAGGDVGFDISR